MYFQYYIKVILASLLLPYLVQGALRKFELRITQEDLDPDCSGEKIPSVLVNKQFLAPTLRANQDDEIELHIFNDGVQPSGIHIHGIRQYGSTKSDGVPGITQSSIQPGESFVSKFVLKEQHGTFFYHAHVGTQDDTVQGAFIIYPKEQPLPIDKDENGFDKTYEHLSKSKLQIHDGGEKDHQQQQRHADKNEVGFRDGPYEYDDELILHLTEFWHKSYVERDEYYMGPSYIFDPSSDSILMNGRTINDPQNLTQILRDGKDQDQKCKGFSALNVLPNKTYRLRVIGGSTFRILGLQIKDHDFTIIEVDGELIQPYTTDNLEVAPGQRFSVLLHTKENFVSKNDGQHDDDLFVIATSYRYRSGNDNGWTKNGFAYLRYIDSQFDHYNDDVDASPYDHIVPPRLIESLEQKQNEDYEIDEQKQESPIVKRNKKYRNHKHDEEDEDEDDHEHWHSGHHGEEDHEDNYNDDEDGETQNGKKNSSDHGDEQHGNDHQGGKEGGWDGQKGGKGGQQGGKGGKGGNGGQIGGANQPTPIYEFIDYPEVVVLPPKDWIWPNLAPLDADIYREMLELEEPDRLFVFRSDVKNLPDNTTRYTINDRITTVMEHEEGPSVLSKVLEKYPNPVNRRLHLESDGYDSEFETYPTAMNETIDIVFQNAEHKGRCLVHPWHTHGHSHYLIATGVGEYNHEEHKEIRNFPHPIYRDVSTVYPTEVNPETKGCGWTKVRLYTDNPGVWAVHCHITAHMMLGKLAILEEASEYINSYNLYK
ncbi:unnamed protein product [Cunninghamella blakesleeana]